MVVYEKRIPGKHQGLTKVTLEKSEEKKFSPYYRHLEDKVSRENLHMVASGLTEKQIEERWELMLLLAPNEWEKEIIRNFKR